MLGWLGERPALFRAYYARHPRFRHLLVRPDTDLVIEGFPRSANSFAVLAFEQAQPSPPRLAHHLHAPAQLELAVRYGVPVLVLLREPIDAVASLLIREPGLDADVALARYHAFHRAVERHVERLVLARFTQVTRDFGSVIEAVNQRFGRSFTPYRNGARADARVFEAIDALNRTHEGGGLHRLARPDAARASALDGAARLARANALAPAARALYERLAGRCAP